MKTDSEMKKELVKIGELLNLPIIGEITGACANYKLNDHQSLFVRLMGAGRGKGYASISPLDKRIYYTTRAGLSESIHFSEGKAPEAIAKDVTNRLIKKHMERLHENTIEEVERINSHKKAETKLVDDLTALGFDKGYQSDTKMSFSDHGLYIYVNAEDGRPHLDRISFPSGAESHVRILKAIIKEARKIQEERNYEEDNQ